MTTINYNGQELERITEGYWSEGVTLMHSESGIEWEIGGIKAICLHNGRAFYEDGRTGITWKYWAILPPKQAPRRLTNREVMDLCKKGWDALWMDEVGHTWCYSLVDEKEPCCAALNKLRAPGSDEWVEPTADLLEAKK